MEHKKLIVDTSYWISNLIQNDPNHDKSNELKESVIRFSEIFVTDYIFLEMFTIISQKKGKLYLQRVMNSHLLDDVLSNEICIEKEDYQQIKSEYLSLENKDISFVDLSTVHIAQKYNLKCLTFDKHFKKLGKLYKVEIIGC